MPLTAIEVYLRDGNMCINDIVNGSDTVNERQEKLLETLDSQIKIPPPFSKSLLKDLEKFLQKANKDINYLSGVAEENLGVKELPRKLIDLLITINNQLYQWSEISLTDREESYNLQIYLLDLGTVAQSGINLGYILFGHWDVVIGNIFSRGVSKKEKLQDRAQPIIEAFYSSIEIKGKKLSAIAREIRLRLIEQQTNKFKDHHFKDKKTVNDLSLLRGSIRKLKNAAKVKIEELKSLMIKLTTLKKMTVEPVKIEKIPSEDSVMDYLILNEETQKSLIAFGCISQDKITHRIASRKLSKFKFE